MEHAEDRLQVHKDAIHFCQDVLKRKLINWETFCRDGLSKSVRNVDLVVSIGGDGTLLQASHFMDGSIPILGVNSDPTQVKEVEEFSNEFDAARSTGYLCAATVENFEQEEWRRCLKPLSVDTIAKLKKGLPELENEALLKLVSECSSLALNPTRKDALNQSPLKIVLFALAKMCAHSSCRQVLWSSDLFVAIYRLKQSPDSTISNYAAIICDKMGA